MIKNLPLFCCLFVAFTSFGQNRAVIKGRVTDSASKQPLELATIAVLEIRDTSSYLVAYTTSDKKGDFTLHNMPTGIPLKILVTFVGYRPLRKVMDLKKGEIVDLGIITLNSNQLNEVMVKGERPPVVMRKDTIEFNTEAFKTRPNAVVEDLLKKLPGIEVNGQGGVLFNGKGVKKILVDGHEFFISDPRIATRNLDADMIDKVQVYDDRDNDPNHLVPDAQVDKIINLKFKKAYKKSVFGKFYAGAGTEDRYNTGGLVNLFRDTLQVSFIGLANNLNNTGFSVNDLYTQGGLNRGGSDAFYRSGIANFGSTGIQKITSAGININTDYGKKVKINFAYFYNHTNNVLNSITNRQQLLTDTDFTTNATTDRISLTNKHNLTAQVVLKPNNATQITYSPAFSYTDNQTNSMGTGNSFSNFIPQVSQTVTTDNNSGNTGQFQQSLSYNYQFKKQGESLTLTHNLSINPGYGTDYNISALHSFTTGLTSYDLDRLANTLNSNNDFNVEISYRYPLTKKLVGTIGFTDDYNHQVNNTITYDFDPATGLYDSFLQTLSTSLTRNQTKQTISPGFQYTFKRGYMLTGNVNTDVLQVNNQFGQGYPDINQHFVNFLPSINLTLLRFNIGYSEGFNLPNIGDLVPYTVVFSPLYQVTGNPGLKPATRQNYNAAYNMFNSQRQTNFNISGSVSFEQNGVFRQRTLNAFGAETSTPINMNGRHTFSVNAAFGKRYKKHNDLTFSESTRLGLSESHSFFEINSQDGYQDTYNINLVQQLSLNWKDIIDVTQLYTLSNSTVNYTSINYPNQNNTTHVLDTHLNVYLPKKIDIESTYTYTYNPLVSPGFQKSANLFNLSVARSVLKKDRGEIKLSCYDILNQNVSSHRTISENIINDTQSQVLKRYFLLTPQFKFNKSLTK